MRTFYIEPEIFGYEAELRMILQGKLRDHPSSIGIGSTDIHKNYFTWKIDWPYIMQITPKDLLLNPKPIICAAKETYKYLGRMAKHIRPAHDSKEFKGQLMTLDDWTIFTDKAHRSGYITNWDFSVLISEEQYLYTPETRHVIVRQKSLFHELPFEEKYLNILPDHPYVLDIQNNKIVEINSINHAELKDLTLGQLEVTMLALEEATR